MDRRGFFIATVLISVAVSGLQGSLQAAVQADIVTTWAPAASGQAQLAVINTITGELCLGVIPARLGTVLHR